MRLYDKMRIFCWMLALLALVGCSRESAWPKNKRTVYLYGRGWIFNEWNLRCDGLDDGSGIVSIPQAVSRLDRTSDVVLLTVDSMVPFCQYRETMLCFFTNCIQYAVDLGNGKFADIYPFPDSELEGHVCRVKTRRLYFFASDRFFAKYPEDLYGPIEAEMPGEESGFQKWFLDLQNHEPFADLIPTGRPDEHTCFELVTQSNTRFGEVKEIFREACEKGHDVLCWSTVENRCLLCP